MTTQDENQLTMLQFIKAQRIGMKAERVDSNPNMEQDTKHPMDHWLCRFNGPDKRSFEVNFSMGQGHNGKAPKAADVLDCLASDAASVANARNFEDWCAEYGYDIDSRKAERTYNVCLEQADKLKAFLGIEAFEQLLWNTERL